MTVEQEQRDRRMLMLATRHAARAIGYVEPNPAVGCVVARGDEVLGIGHHRVFGDLHAEREAMASCARQGNDPSGATMYVTLEPCNHTGKQPPCTQAVLDAGIREVVIARPDPGEQSGGGGNRLRDAGVSVRFTDVCPEACAISNAFVTRVHEHRPQVIAKWAQSVDGRIATRTGDSKWISNERSRRMVHRWRARVDGVMVGIGTVLADDPLLIARDVSRHRRIARRIVVDPSLRTPVDSRLVRSIDEAPITIACGKRHEGEASELRDLGIEVVPLDGPEGDLDMVQLFRHLASEHDLATVLVEGGAALMGSLLRWDLIDECRVFVGPLIVGDDAARPAFRGGGSGEGGTGGCELIADAARFRLRTVRSVGEDVMMAYGRQEAE